MSFQPTPMDLNAVTHAWRLVQHILSVLTRSAASHEQTLSQIPRRQYDFLRRDLTMAESLIRRILVLIALTMKAPVPRLRGNPAKPNAERPKTQSPAAKDAGTDEVSKPAKPRLFCLTEPNLPRREAPAAIVSNTPKPGPRPSIWSLGMPDPPQYQKRRFEHVHGTTRDGTDLMTRLQAAQQVIDNPGFHVGRMAQWMARRRAELSNAQQIDSGTEDQAPTPKRLRPLRPGKAPGISKKRLGSNSHDIYRWLNYGAHTALDITFDTS